MNIDTRSILVDTMLVQIMSPPHLLISFVFAELHVWERRCHIRRDIILQGRCACRIEKLNYFSDVILINMIPIGYQAHRTHTY